MRFKCRHCTRNSKICFAILRAGNRWTLRKIKSSSSCHVNVDISPIGALDDNKICQSSLRSFRSHTHTHTHTHGERGEERERGGVRRGWGGGGALENWIFTSCQPHRVTSGVSPEIPDLGKTSDIPGLPSVEGGGGEEKVTNS